MKIAVLGWGSLIWNPSTLKIKSVWFDDGPSLPVEFSRISNDGRLTLVIDSKVEHSVRTLYAISKYTELNEAILDLAAREGCGKNKIGTLIKEGFVFSDYINDRKHISVRDSLSDWIRNKGNIDAVIWTQLSPKYKDKFGNEHFEPSDAINYLKSLALDTQARAEEYIRKAPLVVRTPIRDEIEKELGWTPMS